MSRGRFALLSLAWAGVVLAGSKARAQQNSATMRIVPIGVVGGGPAPVGNTLTMPGGGVQVEFELQIEWGPGEINSIVARIDGDFGFDNGIGSPLVPFGFGTTADNIGGGYIVHQMCQFSNRPGCPMSGSVPESGELPCDAIDPSDGSCVPNLGFAMAAGSAVVLVDRSTTNFLYLAFDRIDGRSFDGTNNYFGTLIIDVPPSAEGSYTIRFLHRCSAPDFDDAPPCDPDDPGACNIGTLGQCVVRDSNASDQHGQPLQLTLATAELIVAPAACCRPSGGCSIVDTAADCDALGGTIIGFECGLDTDGDGSFDACGLDGCPTDPNKTEPGICGCNVADADSDGDAVADCNDVCPGFDDAIPGCESAIPAASEWGLLILALSLMVAGKLGFGGRATQEA